MAVLQEQNTFLARANERRARQVQAAQRSAGYEMVRTVCAALDSGAATRVGVKVWGVLEWGQYERGWFETQRSFSRRPGMPLDQKEATWLTINPGSDEGVKLLSQDVEWRDGTQAAAVTEPQVKATRLIGPFSPAEMPGLSEQPLAAQLQFVRGVHGAVLMVAHANGYTPRPIGY